MAQGAAQAVGRPGAKRGRAVDRRARAAADGVPRRPRVGICSAASPPPTSEQFRRRADLGRRPADSGRQGFRSGHRPAQGRRRCCSGRGGGPSDLAERLRPAEFRVARSGRQALHVEALSAVHHQHAAAGSQSQARLHRPADDAGGPKPVRERPHHLHANRLDQPGQRGDRGGPRAGRARNTATNICPAEPRVYRDQGQERPGSARSDPPGRPSVRISRSSCAAS